MFINYGLNDEFIPAGVRIDPQGHVFVTDLINYEC